MSNENWPLYSGDPAQGRAYLKVWPHDIRRGTVFDTEFETGCVAIASPDESGNFEARDSEGVVCQFHVLMPIRITEQRNDS